MLVLSASCKKTIVRDNADLPRGVAHAMGILQGNTYTNSLEAFAVNYQAGCRFFETDIWITSDGKAVFAHDNKEEYLGLVPGYTWNDFMHSRIMGRYTPMDTDTVARLFQLKPDWLMLTDVKADQRESLGQLSVSLQAKGVDWRRRVLPHVFNLTDDYQVVNELGFPRKVLALYRMEKTSIDEVLAFVKVHPDIVALNIPDNRWTPEFGAELSAMGVKAYVHTIDDPRGVAKYIAEGAWGIVTDTECTRIPAPDPSPAKP